MVVLKLRIVALLLNLVWVVGGLAASKKPESFPGATAFGHNFSSTSYTLDQGECTFGLQVIGCGVSEDLSLGTSPWLYSDYNMLSLFARAGWRHNAQRRQALQLSYFKTFQQKGFVQNGYYDANNMWHDYAITNDYIMHAVFLQWIDSWTLSPYAVNHFNVSVQHYIDDRRPFSLRRPSMRPHKTQLNLTTLLETHVVGPLFLMSELGVLNVGATQFHLMAGTSAQLRGNRWMAHLGFSINGTLNGFRSTDRFDAQKAILTTGSDYSRDWPASYNEKDFALHPEFSLQVYF